MANGDDGSPIKVPDWPDRSIQVYGTFGTGGTVVIEGALEETSPVYATLNDHQGNALSMTTAKIEAIGEDTFLIRPRVTAGDETTSITVVIMGVKKEREVK